jgi:hypothetical protein
MSRMDSPRRCCLPLPTLALLFLCLWVCSLHFLTDVVFHLDSWVQFERPAERVPSQGPHGDHQEEQFVLPSLSSVPAGCAWLALRRSTAQSMTAANLPPPRTPPKS